MSVYLTETEQLALFRKWCKEYGLIVIMSIAIAVGLSFGFKYWQSRRLAYREQASIAYTQLMEELGGNDKFSTSRQADQLADQIIKQYKGTTYADLALLLKAKQAVDNGDLAAAQKELSLVAQHGQTDAIRVIANLRLARVLSQLGEYEQALSLLSKIDTPAYESMKIEIMGDIYAKQKQFDQAKAAYQHVITLLATDSPLRAQVEMKMAQLPV